LNRSINWIGASGRHRLRAKVASFEQNLLKTKSKG